MRSTSEGKLDRARGERSKGANKARSRRSGLSEGAKLERAYKKNGRCHQSVTSPK
jgi:hypothetical protein